ncbi:family 16 glycosylhydrolase [Treponema bryantii]|uniref:glycoside hydrolase family 16 protein n=1 Tax=Treponema bryantii TaxID=163 RepID=UPI000412BCCA|nr:glycoside hydrolase family 16 protein [Treponema bryantii]
MTTSCMFMPPKDTKETIKTEAEEAEDGTTIYKKDGLTCVWHDEFDYEGVPDTTKWKYQTGHGNDGWGNQELQNYTDNTTTADTAVVEEGVLKIKAKYENGEWKSARLNSKESWKYGFIEARLKITDRKGAWPAFWMMPDGRADWPDCGEIDIMENAPAIENCDHRVFSSLHARGHFAANPKSIGGKTYDENLSSEWHTFGIKWTEQEITCYYDDVAVGGYENNGTIEDWPYDQKFYIILNLAIGGQLGGTGFAPSLGGNAEFLIDYVRVYQ